MYIYVTGRFVIMSRWAAELIGPRLEILRTSLFFCFILDIVGRALLLVFQIT